jgi:peptide deformylase
MIRTPDVLLFGDRRLRNVAEPCGSMDLTLQEELSQMRRALADFRNQRGWGRALAAPQVGLSKRAIVCQLGDQAVTLLNPQITWRSAERVIVWDDCFSLPEIAAPVVRHASVSVCYQDEDGRTQQMTRLATDIAELIQHEIDHLDGVLFIDRVISPTYVVAREHRADAAATHGKALLAATNQPGQAPVIVSL